MAPIYALFTDTAAGIEHIRSQQWQDFFVEEFLEQLDHAQIPFYQTLCVRQWLFLVLDMGVVGLATVVSSMALHLRQTASSNGIGLALVNLISLSQGITIAMRTWAECETSCAAVSRVLDFAKSTPKEPAPIEGGGHLGENWPENGRIEFESMSTAVQYVNSFLKFYGYLN